ncbi:MAG: hypothetical protein M1837_003395 [Sclerophora amabilis]|nr:MAG: hypothetical protein M1837_003395 [Sclerophora amabilis]
MTESEQSWFFLFEDVRKPDFVQKVKNWEEVVTAGLSFATALKILSLDRSDPVDFNFFIHSSSMKAAWQLRTGKSMFVTHRLNFVDGSRSLGSRQYFSECQLGSEKAGDNKLVFPHEI